MTVEAALLGRPAISVFPGEKPLYISYLEKEGLVETIRLPRQIAQIVKRTIESKAELSGQRKRGTELLRQMEDPINVISGVVRETLKQSQK